MKTRDITKIIFLTAVTMFFWQADAQELKVYFGNLHSHTSYSDGSAEPKDAYRHARDKAKLDFLAITEHNHVDARSRIARDPSLYSGARADSVKSTAATFTKDGRFIALYGQEFSTIGSGNHANVFETDDVIQTRNVPNGKWNLLLTNWLVTRLDSQGKPAIILLNHPTQADSPNELEYGIDDFSSLTEWRKALNKHARLINIVNGPSHGNGKPGAASEREFLRYLNLGLYVAPTADQDNHKMDWGTAADTRTAVITSELTKGHILDALRNRHAYATEDRNLAIIATVNGNLIGTRVHGEKVPQAGTELDIAVKVRDPDEAAAMYTVDVYSDVIGGSEYADVVARLKFSGDGEYRIKGVQYSGGNQYVFLKITQTDDDSVVKDRAWLAPVWFEPVSDSSGDNSLRLTLSVDLVLEEVKITNLGEATVDLNNWSLVSVQGGQRYQFSRRKELKPGEHVILTSGRNARDEGTRLVKWTTSYIWDNNGDKAELYDAQGKLMVTTE